MNIGTPNESEELKSLKRKLADKDSQHANVQSTLFKREIELNEMKMTLDDTLHKLRHEADKALGLQQELKQCSEKLADERTYRENSQKIIDDANLKLKEEASRSRELQSIIDKLSHGSDGTKAECSKLELEKRKLESRLKEMEANLHQVVTAATPARTRPTRARSSSLSGLQITSLQQENNELRSARAQHEAILQASKEKLQHAQEDLIAVQNEKTALERKLVGEITQLRKVLEERQEEMDMLKAEMADGSAVERERELLERLEQEEAKIQTLEGMLGEFDAMKKKLQRVESRLQGEITKVQEAEGTNVELVCEKEAALDQLDASKKEIQRLNVVLRERDSQIHILEREMASQQTLLTRASAVAEAPAPQEADQATVLHIEKLLSAIERLRSERDQLRDHVEFLQAESSAAATTLESRVSAAAAMESRLHETSLTVTHLRGEVDSLRLQLSDSAEHNSAVLASRNRRIRSLELAVLSSAVVSQQLHGSLAISESRGLTLSAELDLIRDHHAEASRVSEERKSDIEQRIAQLHEAQLQLAHANGELEEMRQERRRLLDQISRLEFEAAERAHDLTTTRSEDDDTRRVLSQTEAQLAEILKTLEDVESQRDSLTTEVTNLQNDLEHANEQLGDAEQRYRTLQGQRLEGLSSSEATRALRSQIQDLEARVMRRTEQIGIHQHDIKRLETNLRLQEERVSEMTMELDMMADQKEAMVEDCAAAREARDEALMRVEALEWENEALEAKLVRMEEDREGEVDGMVGVWVDCASNSRKRILSMKSALASHVDHLDEVMRRSTMAGEDKERAVEELHRLQLERDTATRSLEEAVVSLDSLRHHVVSLEEEVRQVYVALAVSQQLLRVQRHAKQTVENRASAAEAHIISLQQQVERHMSRIESLDAELDESRNQSLGYAAEVESLDLRTSDLEKMLQDLHAAKSDLELRHRQETEELLQARADLEVRLARSSEEALDGDALQQQLDDIRVQHANETQKLRQELETTRTHLEETRSLHDGLQTRHRRIMEEHGQSQEDLAEQLSSAQTQLESLEKEIARLRDSSAKELAQKEEDLQQSLLKIQSLEAACSELEILQRRTSEELTASRNDLETQLKQSQERCSELQTKVDHMELDQQEQSILLQSVKDRCRELEASQAELDEELASTIQELEESRTIHRTMEEEKMALQVEITSLTAEIQKCLSMQRYLESQVRDSERSISSLNERLELAQTELLKSQKANKTADMNLTLQASQHEHAVASIRRELAELRSRPNLESTVVELNERIEEMDEMLRNKCTEIEENDDRMIEILKEKKKLTTKVEMLSRKVQTLQNKLTAANERITTPPPIAGPSQSRQLPTVQIPPVPPVPQVTNQPSTPLRRTPSTRTLSGPSSLPRPKTPDSRSMPPSGVSRAKTPESRRPSSVFVAEVSSSVVAGKKRPVPEDFEDCESVPPEGIMTERGLAANLDSTTPRSRKILQSVRTGFTPKRHAGPAPSSSQLSPVRRMTTAAFPPPIISDVTNSPRQTQATTLPTKAVKKSWLGKIRGVPSGQPPAGRSFTSNAPVFDPYQSRDS